MTQSLAHPANLYDAIAHACERLAIGRPDLGSLAINDFSTLDTHGARTIIGYQVFEISPTRRRALACIRTDNPEAGLSALSAFFSPDGSTADEREDALMA